MSPHLSLKNAMDQHQIHYEIFARRAGATSLTLEAATEDRERAMETAREMLEGPRFVAVKVTKEIQDPDTGGFKTVTIFSQGEVEAKKAKVTLEDPGAACISPADLYTVHARDRIGRLLEPWLARNKATAFELLHRPDLIEKLDASGLELQHAIQKISVPEAQARGVGVHEVIRNFQGLTQRAIDRVIADGRKKQFADLKSEQFSQVCTRLCSEPDKLYYLGGAVAAHLAAARTWGDKVAMLLDLADAAPKPGEGRGLAFMVLEQPLGEILRSRVGLADLLGEQLDLGGQLAALTRLTASDAVDALSRADVNITRQIPPLEGPAARLAKWLQEPALENVRLQLGKRIISELTGMRRLRPSDPRGEIEVLRALAMALTAAAGRLLPLEEVREAFIDRSKTLIASDFVGAYLKDERSAMQEATDLVWLLENVTGPTNRLQAVRWLGSTVASLRFETEACSATVSPMTRLQRLAEIYTDVVRSGGDAPGVDGVLGKLGELGGRIEADSKLTASLGRAAGPMAPRLGALLKLATGEAAPPGPAADRAKAEALKLIRAPEALQELANAPEAMAQVRQLARSLDAAA